MSTEAINETETKESSSDSHEQDVPSQEWKKNLKDRLLLPLGIPVIASAVVAALGISFSRVFLAGAKKAEEAGAVEAVESASKSPAPVIWATIITLVVLFGAAGISMMTRLRKTTFLLMVSTCIIVAILSGSVLAGAGDESGEEVLFGSPTPADIAAADPANFVEVDALPSNQFQAKKFEAKAGVVRLDYVGKGGGHILKFKDTRFNWFSLAVNGTSTDTGEVVLEPGEYVIFCPVPGHEAAGMVADLVVK